MRRISHHARTWMFLLLLILYGCGQDDNKNTHPSLPTAQATPVVAKDGFKEVTPSVASYINLSQYVKGGSGSNLRLENVALSNIDSYCGTPSVDGLGFHTTVSSSGLCEYRYTVTNGDNEADGKFVLMSAGILDVILPQIPLAIEVGQMKKVNLKEALSDKFPIDTILNSEVILLGNGNAIVDQTTHSISYTATATGLSRVLYRLEDQKNTVYIGFIDIAVSSALNQAPIAKKFKLNNKVPAGVTVQIDVGPHVEDPDQDQTLQLVEVHSYNADVASLNPEDLSNTSFTFKANNSGVYYVAYVISDQYGGYAVSLVEIEVKDDLGIWQGIPLQGHYYFPAIKETEAIEKKIDYSGVVTDDDYTPSVKLAQLTINQLNDYCSTLNSRILEWKDWQKLISSTDIKVNHNWPTKYPYVIKDKDSKGYVRVWKSEYSEKADLSGKYSTLCVTDVALSYLSSESKTEAEADGMDKAIVAVQISKPLKGEIVSATLNADSSASLDARTIETDSNGVVRFKLTNIKSETVTLTADYNGKTVAIKIRFTGSIATAELTFLTTTDNQPYTGVNEVTAILKDSFGNGIKGYSVTMYPITGGTSISIDMDEETDSNGIQKARISWKGSAPSTDSKITLLAYYTRPDSQTLSKTSQVTFKVSALGSGFTDICGGAINDRNETNAAGKCLKIASIQHGGEINKQTKWFTSSPSVALLDSLGYKIYDRNVTTNANARVYQDAYFNKELGASMGLFSSFYKVKDQPGNFHERWCAHMAEEGFAGRSNWHPPSSSELNFLIKYMRSIGTGYTRFGWPRGWYLTPEIQSYNSYKFSVSLDSGAKHAFSGWEGGHASCVSDL
ncbi:hypothetical protein [Vibrio salilacus]|uniref:hypothetical protein n=1 Tax=Vibrio salilacus TaxID=1323749 RepID=UPI0012FD0719|nr:hypothetical protein [Vibrio salilacus]